MNNSKMTESFVSQTIVGGKNDGQFLTGSVTVTNRGEEIASFSTIGIDKSTGLTYNKEANNVTVFQMESKMPEYVVDFSEFSKVLDELINKTYANYKSAESEESAESDTVGKYRKMYEASVKIEALKQKRAAIGKQVAIYNESIASITSQIEELNKIFTTN